jgi:hypothetical protein
MPQKNHYYDPRLKRITDLKVPYSKKLLGIKFKCYFSFYFYFLLKHQVRYMRWNNNGVYRLALPIEVNVNRLKNQLRVCKNTIKRALKELMTIGLIEKVDRIKPQHSSCVMILVHNDALIESFDAKTGKVIYSQSLSFNFSKK